MFTKKDLFQWTCPQCGEQETAVIHTFLSVQEDSTFRKKVLDASLFRITCSCCGREEYYTGPFLYVDEELQLVVVVGEVSSFQPNIRKYMDLGYQVRKVPQLVNLTEKILILQSQKDDCIVELMKVMNQVLMKEQEYDQMLYAPDKEKEYFDLIKDGELVGRIPFLFVVYDDLCERFGTLLQNEDKQTIDYSWAVSFLSQHLQLKA